MDFALFYLFIDFGHKEIFYIIICLVKIKTNSDLILKNLE